jgi:restriction endonuclease
MSIGTGDNAEAERIDATDENEWDAAYHHSPLVRELRRLKTLRNSQRRGYDFQDFVGSLFKQQHFSVVPSAGTARPRQTDLLATRGDETYLIETKWRTSKANINDVDSLFSRLDSAPPAVIGLFVSYAGFTEEAIKKVELRSNRPVILLNGDELEQLVEWNRDIVQLLVRKKTSLLTHRRVFLGGTGGGRKLPRKGQLAVSPAEFVFLDGPRSKWIHGAGDFGQFTFVQELPDVDWVPAQGRSVTLDLAVPVHDERGIVALLHHLSGMGWATAAARWSIQQAVTNWHGMGASAFAEALQGWRERYMGIPTHHSEEFCYFDVCDGGFYSLRLIHAIR